jgi:hypothetical protein
MSAQKRTSSGNLPRRHLPRARLRGARPRGLWLSSRRRARRRGLEPAGRSIGRTARWPGRAPRVVPPPPRRRGAPGDRRDPASETSAPQSCSDPVRFHRRDGLGDHGIHPRARSAPRVRAGRDAAQPPGAQHSTRCAARRRRRVRGRGGAAPGGIGIRTIIGIRDRTCPWSSQDRLEHEYDQRAGNPRAEAIVCSGRTRWWRRGSALAGERRQAQSEPPV